MALIVAAIFFVICIPIFAFSLYIIKIGGSYFFVWAWIFMFMTTLVWLIYFCNYFFL